jgi:hypothetical protein
MARRDDGGKIVRLGAGSCENPESIIEPLNEALDAGTVTGAVLVLIHSDGTMERFCRGRVIGQQLAYIGADLLARAVDPND